MFATPCKLRRQLTAESAECCRTCAYCCRCSVLCRWDREGGLVGQLAVVEHLVAVEPSRLQQHPDPATGNRHIRDGPSPATTSLSSRRRRISVAIRTAAGGSASSTICCGIRPIATAGSRSINASHPANRWPTLTTCRPSSTNNHRQCCNGCS